MVGVVVLVVVAVMGVVFWDGDGYGGGENWAMVEVAVLGGRC